MIRNNEYVNTWKIIKAEIVGADSTMEYDPQIHIGTKVKCVQSTQETVSTLLSDRWASSIDRNRSDQLAAQFV